MPFAPVLIAAALLSGGSEAAAAAADTDWPHLRGPGLNGHALSSVFEEGRFDLEVAWKVPLGAGYSGVAVADGTALTMCGEGDWDFVVALDAGSGAERWRHRLGPAYRGHDGSEDGPLSTPLIHRGAVYALGPRGVLAAIDLRGGSVKWARDLVADFGSKPPEYGYTTSPVGEGDVIIVQVGGPGHGLAGLDAETGEVRWSVGDDEVEYQSPAVMTLAGRRQLVAFRGAVVAGHDPETGAVLWEHELGRRDRSDSAIPSPVDDGRFAAVVGSGLMVFEVRSADDGYEVESVLRSRELGGTYAQPVRLGDHYYGFRRDFLTCVDGRTGERAWKSRPPGGRGLILVNDRLVVFGAQGRLVVVAATPEGYREEAALQVFDGSAFTWPSFAGDRIFLRNPREIAAVRVVKGRSAGGGAAAAMSGGHAPADSGFGRFLAEVRRAAGADDRTRLVEAFLARHEPLPVVEGEFVHFVYAGDATDVAVSASMLDASRPEPMLPVEGTDLHYRTCRVEPGTRIEYRFQVNLEDWIADPRNPRRVPGRWDGELSELLLPGYVAATHTGTPEGDARGRVETFAVEDPRDGSAREFKVYLPAAYDREPQRSFPLLVVHDGMEWMEKGLLVNTLDNVIGESVAPVVVVFLDTIGMWWLEAGGSGTEAFVDMLAGSVLPALESRYRLRAEPRARAVLGVGDYALTAAYAAMKHPGVFGKAAVQSAGLRNGAQDELYEMIGREPRVPVAFYVDWSLYEARSVDQGFDFGADTRALAAALDRAGYDVAGGEARDAHGWAGWRSRSDRILRRFFPQQ